MPNLFEEFRAVVGVLSAARIPYAICGGIAMSIHAHPRATIDIDLLAPPDAVEQIVASTVVSRAGLIDLKRLRGSPQDMADIALLEGHA